MGIRAYNNMKQVKKHKENPRRYQIKKYDFPTMNSGELRGGKKSLGTYFVSLFHFTPFFLYFFMLLLNFFFFYFSFPLLCDWDAAWMEGIMMKVELRLLRDSMWSSKSYEYEHYWKRMVATHSLKFCVVCRFSLYI